ncbi:hypothetical protein OAS39_03055 [Pirellulales bacterium]|nr:hypothetical protein [Pirellulales bacterium]
MHRFSAGLAVLSLLAGEFCWPLASWAEVSAPAPAAAEPLDLFDAIDRDLVDVTFVARSAERGRIVMKNNTDQPIDVTIPDAFIGVPVLAQFGGGGGGRGGGGRGGGGRGGGGRFNIAPEKITRVDVPLLCLEHGKRDPSSSKPYEIHPIENFVDRPDVIEVVRAFGNGDLPQGAAQAAVWHLNNDLGWDELASKLTGTERQIVRNAYFSAGQIRDAMAIAQEARRMTVGQVVKPRERKADSEADNVEVSAGDLLPDDETPEEATDEESSEEANTADLS